MRTIFRNAHIFSDGNFSIGDIAVEADVIVAMGGQIELYAGDCVVDLCGKHLTPGLIDVHVHLREPGYSYKETIYSGTMAAAHGGYTTVCSMPNLKPAPDSVDNLAVQLDIIRRDAVVRVAPYGCVTRGQAGCGELVDFDALKRDVVGFSDDGRGVQSAELMEEAMRRVAKTGRPIVAHCEIDELLQGGYIHDGEYARRNGHKGICSGSEWLQVERDIELSEKTGCQYHVCHVSTKESVALVRRAKAKGLRVSCETAPHYLLLCDDDMREEGRFKMNPPLRSAADREALIEGVVDGTIEVVATDHAPHSDDEKSRSLATSAMGVVGLECAFGLLYKHLVLRGVISLEKLIALMSVNPALIFSLGGELLVGQKADFTVFDLSIEYKIDSSEFMSQGRSTPFEGWDAQGCAVMTVVDGKVVYADEKIKKSIL